MNNHKMACFVLLVLIGAMVYGTQEMRLRTGKAREAAESAKAEAENAELQRSIAETNLIMLERETFDLRNGYHEWLGHFVTVTNPQEGEQKISDAIRTGQVFLLSQRFQLKEFQGEERGTLIGVLEGDLDFEDDYAKTLNWLGQLEQSVPSCRITSCNIIRGDRSNNIRMKLKLEMPIMAPAVAEAAQAEQQKTDS
ncbi:MAG: hypothetical protein KDN19_05005 [Verrucomicrobiae bacterium]|nr:hypothetical protein [Verrucomicrobiae bacterium]